MSKPSERCFDLSTIKGVRVFGFAAAEAAKHLSALAIENAAHFKAASDRLTRLVLDLDGDRSEKDLALQAMITDFNFRDPQFLGYLEINKRLRMVLLDLSTARFTSGKDHRPPFFRKHFNNVALAEMRHADLISEAIRISDDLLARAKRDLLEDIVEFSDPYEKATLEALFNVSTGVRGNNGDSRRFDYREEAGRDAFCLWWNRKLITDRIALKEPAVRTCVRDVLCSETGIHKLDAPGYAAGTELRAGVYKLVAPGTASSENQIEMPNPKSIEAASIEIEKITKDYIREYRNAERLNLA